MPHIKENSSIQTTYDNEFDIESYANHVLPVSSKFLVGPERAGIWDVRGHRYYMALLQTKTRNNVNSAVKLKGVLHIMDSQPQIYKHYQVLIYSVQ